MQYTVNFNGCKNDNIHMKVFDFVQNIDCEYILEHSNSLNEAVQTSTHNVYFRAKIKIHVYPCKPEFYYYKSGVRGGGV